VDPLNDTPAVLRKYARAHSADLSNFAFLTGSPAQVDEVARRYAVFRRSQGNGPVEHAFLTSLVDRKGILRVQYLGTRFDPEEFTRDLRSLLEEKSR
jgi:protein SCO1/2